MVERLTNPPRQKGTQAEGEAARWLASIFPLVDRSPLRGNKDKGDLTGLPYCVSVKRCEVLKVPKWMRELAVMKINAKNPFGWVMVRRNRERFVFILDEATMAHLLAAAYGVRDEGDVR